MEESLKVIQSDLDELKAKLEKCHQLQPKANNEQKKQLDAVRFKLEAQRDRLAVAMDIISGRDYVVYDIDGDLTVVRPSGNTAKLIKAAEECGGKVKELPVTKEKKINA